MNQTTKFLLKCHFKVKTLLPQNLCLFLSWSTCFTCFIWSQNLLSIHGKFPAAQWVEHCTAKAVPVRMEILFRGTCRFFHWFFFFFFSKIRFLSYFISRYEIMWSVFVYSPFLLQYIREGFVPLLGKVSLFLHSGHASERCWIWTFLKRFCRKVILGSKHFF